MKLKVFLFFSIFSIALFAQDKTVVIKLENDSHLLNDIDFGKNGFVISTGNYIIGDIVKSAYNLNYFKNNLEFDETVMLKKELSQGNQFKGSIISFNGIYLYYIEQDMDGYKKKLGHHITQINLETKNRKEYFIDNSKISGRIGFEFCDDNYFCALSIDNKKGIINGQPFYNLTKFRHSDFEKSELTLQLPSVKYNNKTKSFWTFLDQYEDLIYLSRKEIQLKSDEHFYHIIALNKKDGSISKQWRIPFSIKPNYFLPSSNLSNDYRSGTQFYTGFGLLNDSYSKKRKEGFVKFYKPDAFGSLKLDLESNTIYIYGYNFEGEKKFELIQTFPEDLVRDINSIKDNLHGSKILSIKVLDNHLKVNLSLVSERSRMRRDSYILSKTGEFVKMMTTKNTQDFKRKGPYKAIEGFIDNEKVLTFLKEREKVKNGKEVKLSVLKRSKHWDIIREVKEGKIILYSFKK